MSADVLRKAAALMRERAEAAPWGGGRATSLAVADWLEVFANYDETGENAADEAEAALKVARTYLGSVAA